MYIYILYNIYKCILYNIYWHIISIYELRNGIYKSLMLTLLFYFVLLFLSPVLCHIEYLFFIFNKLYYYYYYYYIYIYN